MKPLVLKINPSKIDKKLLEKAAEVIHNKGLVAFPTETVYGLGANALDPEAVTKIFEAKRRPLDDPLIVHISHAEDLYKLAAKVPEEAKKLVDRFWPGPLTLVLKKSDTVPDLVTTGLDTVAIRMPSNPIARGFIDISGVPIAAPSANMFGRPSPTTAQHVIRDLDGRIDMVLDGGSTEIGIESTVVEFFDDRAIVLRPGGVSVENLRSIMGKVEVSSALRQMQKSPGKYPQHYSPHAKVILVENTPCQVEEMLSSARERKAEGKKVAIMAKEEHKDMYGGFDIKILGPEKDYRRCASRLFHLLREFDEENADVIIAEGIPEKELGLAIMNRLRKAAGEAA